MVRDVPSPVDLRNDDDAREWEAAALQRRPSRPRFFDLMAAAIQALQPPAAQVLDLGSGPGFLACHLLARLPQIHMTLLDFSTVMHALARSRLGQAAQRVDFHEADFSRADWTNGLQGFDAVVTQQAVHETRHKRHAATLHAQVRSVLRPGGIYLVCDHFAGSGGAGNDQLFMSVEEHRRALEIAGFANVRLRLQTDGMVLHHAC
jgi:SAM-dependent methyltransferase